jgi:hypothetical protein
VSRFKPAPSPARDCRFDIVATELITADPDSRVGAHALRTVLARG